MYISAYTHFYVLYVHKESMALYVTLEALKELKLEGIREPDD